MTASMPAQRHDEMFSLTFDPLVCRPMPRVIAAVLLIVYWLPVLAAMPLPASLNGYWVPSFSPCSSSLGIRVSEHDIQFLNGKLNLSFPIDACFSCEGGVRYNGIVIWAAPLGNGNKPFTVYFNAGEREGVAVVEIINPGLRSLFPLGNVELKHCAPPLTLLGGNE